MTQKVLVVGATGRQGDAVVDHLLSGVHGDFAVTAMTRHPYSARRSIASLKDRGVRVVKGDLDDPSSYREHLERVDGAFLVTSPTDGGADTEATRGRGFVDAAMDANLEFLVYGSAMGTNRVEASEVEALSGKQRVETYLEDSDLDYAVIRPGLFVQNFERQREDIEDGVLAWPVEEETLLAVVDVDDVGKVAATAFAHPEVYAGLHIDLAGDVLTLAEIAEGFAEVRGHDVVAEHVTGERERERFGELAAELYAWYDTQGGFRLDSAPLADLGIQPRSLHDALVRDNWVPAEPAGVDDEEATVNE